MKHYLTDKPEYKIKVKLLKIKIKNIMALESELNELDFKELCNKVGAYDMTRSINHIIVQMEKLDELEYRFKQIANETEEPPFNVDIFLVKYGKKIGKKDRLNLIGWRDKVLNENLKLKGAGNR